jgi:LEA14-like dessication related protein
VVVLRLVSKGKAVLVAAFVGLGGLMLFFYLYANSYQPQLDQITINVQSIKVLDVNKITNHADLQVNYVLYNPTTVASTISIINYDLYANGQDVGQGHYDVEDIPMTGRPALFPDSNMTVTDKFDLIKSDNIANIYDSILKGDPVKYEVKGQVTIESTLTMITKDFDVTLG